MISPFVAFHKQGIGVLADALTFAGAAILAKDALTKLSDLQNAKTDLDFREKFRNIHATDEGLQEAVKAVRWSFGGFTAMCGGFLLQILLRFSE